jgi:hypothetical protein
MRRDAKIQSFGIRVLRILNDDFYENLDGVWDFIAREAKHRMEQLGPEVKRGRRTTRTRRAVDTGGAIPPAPPC